MGAVDVPVSEGTRIFLNFSLSLEDGSEVDTNFGGEPVDFVFGDGSLLPGFEHLLLGMSAGQRNVFTVLPDRMRALPWGLLSRSPRQWLYWCSPHWVQAWQHHCCYSATAPLPETGCRNPVRGWKP